MSAEPLMLRRFLRRWATGVTLVTTRLDSKKHGMTVNSFTGISLEPPLILVSLERMTPTRQMVLQSRRFAVAILNENQWELAERFAGRLPDSEDHFGSSEQRTPSGMPIPRECKTYLDCQVVASHEAGTHTIFIGQATAGAVAEDLRPLLYYNRNYRSLAD